MNERRRLTEELFMKRVLSFISLIGITFILVLPSAVSSQEKFSARVALKISGNVKDEVRSYLSRELRSLGDVTIVNDNAEWELYTIAMEVKTKAGLKTGFAIATTILKPFRSESVKAYLNASKEQEKIIDLLMSSTYSHEGGWLDVGDDLKAVCQSVITTFDTDCLEQSRKTHQQIIDYLGRKK